MDMKTTEKQRASQAAYAERQRKRGYYQTRPWLPVELEEWHRLLVIRAREAKEFGTEFIVPEPPKITPAKRPFKGRK